MEALAATADVAKNECAVRVDNFPGNELSIAAKFAEAGPVLAVTAAPPRCGCSTPA